MGDTMRAVGIILAGGNRPKMRELSEKRAIASMPIAGSYRAIDFALSNMTNSNIQKVAVFTQYQSASLNEHLSSSKWWDFGRKQGGLVVFTPTITSKSSNWSRGTADAIYQNLKFLKDCHEPYVVISSADCIYKMDYGQLLEYHIEKKADITVVCKDLGNHDELHRFGIVNMNEEHRIIEFEEKPIIAKSTTVSCGIYVIRRRLLIELIEQAASEGRFDLVTDILVRYKSVKRIYGYKMKKYWKNIGSVEDYFSANMDFLDKEVRDYFFNQYPDIYSKVDDLPPAKYNRGTSVRNSLVASGTIVNGKIENSLIFKNVFVGNNSVVKNSIILNDVHIGENVYIENCIVESRSIINNDSQYKGEGEIRIIVNECNRYII